MKKPLPTNLALALFRFFQDCLPAQRGMSLHTIHSYRDTVQLLLQYTAKDARRKIEAITLGDFTAERVTRFLRHLETERHNGIATRNARLAGLHTFSRFLIAHYPEHMATFQGVLGIPFKRGTQKLPVDYLEIAEVEALLGGINRATSSGSRDYVLFALMLNTGEYSGSQQRRPYTPSGRFRTLFTLHACLLPVRPLKHSVNSTLQREPVAFSALSTANEDMA